MTLTLTAPEQPPELKPRIIVFGVGGAGGNAVNNMIRSNLEGVECVVANTDAQALNQCLAERKIQLGLSLTQGLGAGSRPEVGKAAAEEGIEEIVSQIEGGHMVFVTAGMGGGTGTGAAPVVARAAKDKGLLTVGVVTRPFHFEGSHRMQLADSGIDELKEVVDTLIVIPNQNLFRVANEKTTFTDAFQMADEVLYAGVRGVTELMIMPGLINLDFADIRTIMDDGGRAMMGSGEADGESRALAAAEAAIANPLLEESSLAGAQGCLINITGGPDLTLYEVDEAANRIRDEVDPAANIIFGSVLDESLDGRMRVSIFATGVETGGEGQRPVRRPRATAQPAAPAMEAAGGEAAGSESTSALDSSPEPTDATEASDAETAQPQAADMESIDPVRISPAMNRLDNNQRTEPETTDWKPEADENSLRQVPKTFEPFRLEEDADDQADTLDIRKAAPTAVPDSDDDDGLEDWPPMDEIEGDAPDHDDREPPKEDDQVDLFTAEAADGFGDEPDRPAGDAGDAAPDEPAPPKAADDGPTLRHSLMAEDEAARSETRPGSDTPIGDDLPKPRLLREEAEHDDDDDDDEPSVTKPRRRSLLAKLVKRTSDAEGGADEDDDAPAANDRTTNRANDRADDEPTVAATPRPAPPRPAPPAAEEEPVPTAPARPSPRLHVAAEGGGSETPPSTAAQPAPPPAFGATLTGSPSPGAGPDAADQAGGLPPSPAASKPAPTESDSATPRIKITESTEDEEEELLEIPAFLRRQTN